MTENELLLVKKILTFIGSLKLEEFEIDCVNAGKLEQPNSLIADTYNVTLTRKDSRGFILLTVQMPGGIENAA
jgi:hypothetical protein